TPAKRRGVDEFNVDEITVMPHGDTNVWDEIEGIAELDLNDWGPDEADGLETVDDEMQVMEFDQEEIQRMDGKAENDYNDITTKMVITWKKREEKGGWFRRARLVARQFRWSVDVEDSFAPTSLMAIALMLLHLAACCPQYYGVQVIDVKDAFLMVSQPEEERASVTYKGKRYKLVRCLPGQRTAANRWYIRFRDAAREFGMEDDVMQPTLMGHLTLARASVIRPDPKHIKDIAKKADIKIGNYNLGKRDGSAELSEAETSEFRSIAGKMLYIGGERPDCQFAINALAAWMSKPTKTAWRHAEHLASYLEQQEIEVKKVHLMEVVADSDYAGDQNSRKSITSFQVFLDGNQKPEKHLTFKR
ncbi:unnamed protein product, partial [Effrenium voratum]